MPITGTELNTISTDTSAGAGDAGKIALLNSSGKIDDTMLPTPATGDITAVVAGTGLSGGGTSGSVTLNVLGPLPTGGTTGQALVKNSGTDYDVEWADVEGGGGSTLTGYFFANVESVTNATGVPGDIAVVGGSPTNLYYKNGSNAWTLAGPIAGYGGDITSITAGDGLNGGGASGSISLSTLFGSATSLTVGGSNVDGVNVSSARSDHKHALPAFGTGSGTFCEGNDSRLSNDRTASGLRSATTVVAVSAATAPSSGQVLTATSSTAAEWQTPSSGAPSGSAGGDLGGTYPNPTVTQARGLVSATTTVSVSAATAPTSGQVLTATSSTAATWQTPASSATTVKKAGTTIGTRGAINLIEGSNVTITATDNSGADRVDVTIASTGGGGGSSFSIATDINPRHWWRGDNTTQGGGLATALIDAGTGAKDFSAGTGAATATDGNGKTYLALNGSSTYYTAGVAADWKFLNDGSAWTVALIYHRTALIASEEVLLDTTNDTSASTGFYITTLYSSSTAQGPFAGATRGVGGASAIGVGSYAPDTAITTLIVRFNGANGNPSTAGITTTNSNTDIDMRRRGITVSRHQIVNAFNNANPLSALTLGRRSSTAALYSGARIYEVLIDNKAWSDRLAQGFETYARTTYGVAI